MSTDADDSILNKLDAAVPKPLAQFDAFPKLPSTYKARSESRGFITLFVAFVAFLFVLNDIGEFIWGWPDFEFSVDPERYSFMNVNVDMVVAMPCKYISVDLRDALGDRLFLSSGILRRDGTMFDVGQATKLKEHSEALSVQQAISQSRKSRGLFDTILRRRNNDGFKPTYDYTPHGSACRVWGSIRVKKVTANLHITTLGHGYASREHIDHLQMNLSHIITEFSFGPHFPDMTQPLDSTFEVTHENFIAYQYFLHVVPTTYVGARSGALQTNQYSVTHYKRVLEHNRGTPGIFFKFEMDPMSITIIQRTTTFIQLIIRCVGVIGGVFVCMGYAIRITTAAVETVTGSDPSQGIVAAESSGVKVGLKSKWAGQDLRSRAGKMVRQGSGWVLDPTTPGSPSVFQGDYTPGATPQSSVFSTGQYPPPSPYLNGNGPYTPNSAVYPPSNPGTPVPGSGFPRSPVPGSAGFPPPPPRTPGAGPPPPRGHTRTTSMGPGSQPPTPNPAINGEYLSGVPSSPLPSGRPRSMYATTKKDD